MSPTSLREGSGPTYAAAVLYHNVARIASGCQRSCIALGVMIFAIVGALGTLHPAIRFQLPDCISMTRTTASQYVCDWPGMDILDRALLK
jgi:hypothetical protein